LSIFAIRTNSALKTDCLSGAA